LKELEFFSWIFFFPFNVWAVVKRDNGSVMSVWRRLSLQIILFARSVKKIPSLEKFAGFVKIKLPCLLVACSYKNELLKKAIHTFKYKFVQDLSKPLAVFLIQRLETVFSSEFFPAFWKDEVYSSEFLVIPVPLHQKRFRWRGFNQAELLGKRVSNFFKLPFGGNVLIRRRYTVPQTEIKNKERRKENIKGAFKCIRPERVKTKRIILVDDVCTTASTLNECAKALSKSGAKEIWGLVLARG